MKCIFVPLLSLAAAAVAAAPATPSVAAEAPLYRASGSIGLGAPDWWDYLAWDAPAHRLFAAHGSNVTVIDPDRARIVGQVPVAGANGVAIARPLGKGYAGSSEQHVVVVFDLASLRVLKRIPVEEDTDAAVYDPASERVFVMHGDPRIATAIDVRTDEVAGRISLAGVPEYAAVDGRGKLYVNLKDRGTLARIDTRTLVVDATWPLPGCERPHGLALDAVGGRLFSGCINERLLVLDAGDGRLVAQLPIGAGSDGVAFDARRHRVLSSNGEGTLSVIRQRSADDYVAAADVPTQPSARTLAVDADSGRVFLLAGDRYEKDPAAADPRRRFGIRPGSLRLLVEQPVQPRAPAP